MDVTMVKARAKLDRLFCKITIINQTSITINIAHNTQPTLLRLITMRNIIP
jgi:hypothetical protein